MKSCYVPVTESNEQIFPLSLELKRDGEMDVKEAHKVLNVAASILTLDQCRKDQAYPCSWGIGKFMKSPMFF